MARRFRFNFEKLLQNRCVRCGKIIPISRTLCSECAKGLKKLLRL